MPISASSSGVNQYSMAGLAKTTGRKNIKVRKQTNTTNLLENLSVLIILSAQ
jgi:hypothetical protein